MLTYILVGVAALIILLAGILIAAMLYRTVVPTNMVHIVNSSKGRIVYGKDSPNGNTYYAFPDWIPKIGVSVTDFPISNFRVGLTEYLAYDHKRLPFSVDVQAFFVMQDADVVSQRVSDFGELKQHLLQILSGSVRKICAGRSIEEILSSRSELSDDFGKEVNEQLKAWGVASVNSIEFMNIQDAPGSKVIQDIQKKEESRIDRDSRIIQAENLREAQTKEIEAERQVEVKKQEALQQVGTRTAEKEQAVGIAKEQSKQAIAEQSKITSERNMEVAQVEETRRAEIDKSVAITLAEQTKETQVISAKADKEKQVLDAEAKLEQDKRQAEGNLSIQEADAKGIEAVGKAKADAEKQMQLASVTAQTTLAQEIGVNQEYQNYLINIKQIEINGEVGKANSVALEKANVHIVSGNGSDVGKSFGSVLQGFSATSLGQAIVNKFIPKQDH